MSSERRPVRCAPHARPRSTFLPEFFALFFADGAETFDLSRVKWLDKEVFPNPPQGERRVLDLVAKLPTRRPVAVQSGQTEAWLSLLHVEVESTE